MALRCYGTGETMAVVMLHPQNLVEVYSAYTCTCTYIFRVVAKELKSGNHSNFLSLCGIKNATETSKSLRSVDKHHSTLLHSVVLRRTLPLYTGIYMYIHGRHLGMCLC